MATAAELLERERARRRAIESKTPDPSIPGYSGPSASQQGGGGASFEPPKPTHFQDKGGGGDRRSRPPSSTSQASALPDPPKAPVQQRYRPFTLENGRLQIGDPTRSGDPNRMDLGDILPNLQQDWRSVFRPGEVLQERGGAATQAEKDFVTSLARQGVNNPLGLLRNLGVGGTAEAVQQGLGTLGRGFGKPGVSLAGIPEGVIASAQTAADLTERGIGVAEQAAGVDVDPAQLIAGRYLLKLVANIAERDGETGLAERILSREGLDPRVDAQIVANLIARRKAKGQDTTQLRNVLNVLAPNFDHEEMIARQAQLLDYAGQISPDAWEAARYTYEGLDRMLEVRQRLDRGESIEDILPDVESRLSAQEQFRNFTGQMVLDPLNALDFIKIGKVGGGVSGRVSDWTDDAMQWYGKAADNADEVIDLLRQGDIRPQNWFERNVTFLQRTTETRLQRAMTQSGDVLGGILHSVNSEAVAEAAKVTPVPAQSLLMEAFMNPQSVNVAGTGRTSEDIFRLLGVSEDLVMSPAAIQTRDMMSHIEDAGNLVDRWLDVETKWGDYLALPRQALEGNKAKKARDAAFDAAVDATLKFLQPLEDGARASLNLPEEASFLKKLATESVGARFFQKVQGTMATYFHMGFSPGWAVRNFMNNNVTLALDGVDIITPFRHIEQNMAEYEVLGSSLAQKFGGQGIGEAGRAVEGTPVIGKITPFASTLSGRAERNAGMRAVWEGFKRTMSQHWAQNIPIESFQRLQAAVGDPELARLVLQRAEQAWTPKALAALADDFATDPWRVLEHADPQLIEGLRHNDLWDDVRAILRDPEADVTTVSARFQGMLDGYDDLIARAEDGWMPHQGSVEQGQIAAAEAALDGAGLSPDAVRLILEDRRRSITAWFNAKGQTGNAYNVLLDRLDQAGLRGEWMDLKARMADIEKLWGDTASRAGGLQEDLLNGLWYEKGMDWRNMPQFRGITDRHQAFQVYYFQLHNAYVPAQREYINAAQDLLREVAQATGNDALVRDLPSWEQFARQAPVSDTTRGLFRGLIADLARNLPSSAQFRDTEQGRVHLLNFLKNQGLLDGDATDIVRVDANWEWLDEALQAIQSRVVPAAIEGEPEVVDLSEVAQRVLASMGEPRTAATQYNPMDMLQHFTTQRQETERLLGEVMDFVGARLDDVPREITGEQADAIRQFVKELNPILGQTRQVATQVGNEMRNFALLDYSDRRNFDTLAGFVWSYPYWYMRNLGNFVTRTMDSPGRVASLLKFRAALARQNGDLPEWWRDQLTVNVLGNTYFIPILNMFDPLNGYLGDKFRDEDQRYSPLAAIVNEVGQYGPGVHSVWQFAMALGANAQGNRDAALSWAGYLGQPTKAARAATVLGRAAGLDFLPPGGIGAEPWLWDNGRFEGTKWDARRIGRSLYQMAQDGTITWEEMIDAAYWQEGEIYDQALQRSAERDAWQTLISWGLGAGAKPRPDSEVEIAEADMLRAEIYRRSPYNDTLAADAMSVEEYRLARREFAERYPYMEAVVMFRRSDLERDENLTWTVFNRLPPNNREYFEAVGADPRLLDQFYQSGLQGMSEASRREFVEAIRQLNAVLALPDDASVDEWYAAKDARYAMTDRLSLEFGDHNGDIDYIYELQDAYFATRDSQGYEAAVEFLDTHPILGEFWSRKDEIIQGDPLLVKYYGSMDLLERVTRAEFDQAMAQKYPGLDVDAFWDEYWGLREAGQEEAANALFEETPQMSAYLNDKNRWQVQLRDDLERMAGAIEALDPRWGQLRTDAQLDTPGQQDVAALIESGSRPMGDFVLPEDLSAFELKAAIDLEVSSIRAADSWSEVYSQLKADGDLDDVLNAYFEFKGTRTIQENEVKLKALLVALENIRTTGGWAYAGDPDFDATKAPVRGRSSGGGGAAGEETGTASRSGMSRYTPRRSGGSRLKSSRGGSSSKPTTKQADAKLRNELYQMLSLLKEQSPRYWANLRALSHLSREDAQAFLSDPANAAFRGWLQQSLLARLGTNVPVLLDMLRTRWQPPTSGSSSGSGSSSSSGARPTRQRYNVKY